MITAHIKYSIRKNESVQERRDRSPLPASGLVLGLDQGLVKKGSISLFLYLDCSQLVYFYCFTAAILVHNLYPIYLLSCLFILLLLSSFTAHRSCWQAEVRRAVPTGRSLGRSKLCWAFLLLRQVVWGKFLILNPDS